MKLLLSSLLLLSLCALSSWSVSSATLVVTQAPDVSVMEGETVNITCCWPQKSGRATVDWLKNQIYMKNESFSANHSDCSNLTFLNITREDSGRYTCKVTVDIPFLFTGEGIGTVITVTARDNTKDNTDSPIAGGLHWEEVFIYVLRCLPILALVITFFCLNNLATKAKQHTPAAPGNRLPSAQRIDGDQEEDEREERESEAE